MAAPRPLVTHNGQPLKTRNGVTGRSSFLELIWGFVGGFLFGAGAQVTREAVRGMARSETDENEPLQTTDGQDVSIEFACKQQNFDFVECLKLNPHSIHNCQDRFESVLECQSKL